MSKLFVPNECCEYTKEELEEYLLGWVMHNGTPFTTIKYSWDSGLVIGYDDEAEELYHKAYPYHDEYEFDEDGKLKTIKTVIDEE